MGVYLYLVTFVITAVLVSYHMYERFLTDEVKLARAAQVERYVQEQMELIRKEQQEQRKQQLQKEAILNSSEMTSSE